MEKERERRLIQARGALSCEGKREASSTPLSLFLFLPGPTRLMIRIASCKPPVQLLAQLLACLSLLLANLGTTYYHPCLGAHEGRCGPPALLCLCCVTPLPAVTLRSKEGIRVTVPKRRAI